MNTAARMESNGKPGRIHLSSETADLLVESGKGHWLTKRDDKIQAKGKGELQTWWLGKTTKSSAASVTSGTESAWSEEEEEENEIQVGDSVLHLNEKTHRIVNWTVQSLMNLLERLAASREASGMTGSSSTSLAQGSPGKIPLEEVQEVISFHSSSPQGVDGVDVVLGQNIEDQMEVFVGTIAGMYPAFNSFHNFDHASHVTMNALQMFSKMSKFTTTESEEEGFCISSDLLAVFACAFAALVHDIQHPGVPNFRLKEEEPSMAAKYKDRCIAEQNSFALAWELLAEDRFAELRGAIYCNEQEGNRFRQLVINAVMATDLFDKDLTKQRASRWGKAFKPEGPDLRDESPKQVLDRKSTIVFDHVIQAADISHTMQHWYVFYFSPFPRCQMGTAVWLLDECS